VAPFMKIGNKLEYNGCIENDEQVIAMKCLYTHWTTHGEGTIQLNTDAEE
jgi:hypothetical protein